MAHKSNRFLENCVDPSALFQELCGLLRKFFFQHPDAVACTLSRLVLRFAAQRALRTALRVRAYSRCRATGDGEAYNCHLHGNRGRSCSFAQSTEGHFSGKCGNLQHHVVYLAAVFTPYISQKVDFYESSKVLFGKVCGTVDRWNRVVSVSQLDPMHLAIDVASHVKELECSVWFRPWGWDPSKL